MVKKGCATGTHFCLFIGSKNDMSRGSFDTVCSTTVGIDWTMVMAEFNWNSVFWDPWISWRIKRFLSSNGKQDWVHKGPKFLTSIHKCESWWTFENICRLPYISWNCSQNVKIILSTASRESFDILCWRSLWILWDNNDKCASCSLGNISIKTGTL